MSSTDPSHHKNLNEPLSQVWKRHDRGPQPSGRKIVRHGAMLRSWLPASASRHSKMLHCGKPFNSRVCGSQPAQVRIADGRWHTVLHSYNGMDVDVVALRFDTRPVRPTCSRPCIHLSPQPLRRPPPRIQRQPPCRLPAARPIARFCAIAAFSWQATTSTPTPGSPPRTPIP